MIRRVRDWIAGHAGSPVVGVQRLPGATSSIVQRVDLADGRRLVLRCVDRGWLLREPDLARHEACALRVTARVGLPAPRLVALDATGEHLGSPGVLMSWIDGRVTLPRRPTRDWIEPLAETLACIHDHRARTLSWRYRSWTDPGAITVPGWTRRPDVWQRAMALHAEGPRPGAAVLLHRDFHPTNVLWRTGRIVGVVDWINACRGPRGVDVAHCRANLALLYGSSAADRFLAAYTRRVTRYRHDAYWDLDAVLDAWREPRFYRPWAEFGVARMSRQALRTRVDRYIAAIVAREPR